MEILFFFAIFSISLRKDTFRVIWYIKPFISENKNFNNFLALGFVILNLLTGSLECNT